MGDRERSDGERGSAEKAKGIVITIAPRIPDGLAHRRLDGVSHVEHDGSELEILADNVRDDLERHLVFLRTALAYDGVDISQPVNLSMTPVEILPGTMGHKTLIKGTPCGE